MTPTRLPTAPPQTGFRRPPRVAIIGAGPSGCFTAQALRKRIANIQITVFDALPTPYGLIRHGIAPDHQGAKAVQRQFDRLFARDGVRFVGNTLIPGDLPCAQLTEAFDAVVLATGLAR
ncbi:MAG: monooxygenase, partial [Comamonadaceae bacterium]